MFKKIWNQIIVSIPHFDQFFYYSHENFVILAKFCCHYEGIFQGVNYSLREGRSRSCGMTARRIFFVCPEDFREQLLTAQ
jgi:hypothetical protein